MSQQAGAHVKRGIALMGGLYANGAFSIGAIDNYSNDIINIGYAETKYLLSLTKDFDIRFAAQFTDQRSMGDDLLTGHSFSTSQVGVKTDMSYARGVLSLAYTVNSRGTVFRIPGAGTPAIPVP